MKARLTKEFQFEAAQTLPHAPAGHKCRLMHGHSFTLEVSVEGEVDPATGWIYDHARISRAMDPLIEQLDHRYLNEVPGLENPTIELMCAWFWEKLSPQLPGLAELVLHETPSARCSYRGEQPGPMRRRVFLLILLGVPALLVGGLLGVPILRPTFMHATPNPPVSHDDAVRAIRDEIAATPPNIAEEARTILLDHGHPTPRVFVLLHGLSNNPQQFLPLGTELFHRGHNVLIPRLPYHGDRNTMTEDWARLSEKDVLAYANRAADLAHGLGEKVIVSGLSLNGTACAWLAQNRPDLDRAVVLAPFLAPAGFPFWSARPVERALLRLPNMFFWWDPRQREKLPRPPFVYPRFPTRLIGETMRLGSEVYQQAGTNRRPAERSPWSPPLRTRPSATRSWGDW